MKAFWAILAALIVAGGAYVAVSAQTARRAEANARQAELTSQAARQDADNVAAQLQGQLQAQRQATSAAAAPVPVTPKQQEIAATSPVPVANTARIESSDAASTKTPGAPSPAPEQTNTNTVAPESVQPVAGTPEAAKPEAVKPGATKQDESKPEVAKPDSSKPETKAAEQPKGSSGGEFSVTDVSVAPAGVTGAPTKAADGAQPVVAVVKQTGPAKFKGFEVIPAKIEKNDDGSMLVDGQYTIRGDGTAEKPYVVPWEVLTSVEETFDPQASKRKLPERVTMLDGKVVKLSGYVAFPMMVKQAKECLSMLNQWDGCCIGVPPTPYDAVEVALKRTISGDERFTTSGTVIGTFRVKPYLQGDWLIGLYVMEVGDLKSKDFGGPAGS